MAGEAATAGAAIGTAIMPGVGTAIGALAGAYLDGEMSKGGDKGGGGGVSTSKAGDTGPKIAASAVYGSGINADAWNVNFSGTQSNSTEANKRIEGTGPTATMAKSADYNPDSIGAALGGNIAGVPYWLIGAVVGLVIWRRTARK